MNEAEAEAETKAEAPQRAKCNILCQTCVCVGDFVCMCVFVQDLYIFNFRFYECNANTFSCMNKSNDLVGSASRIHKRQYLCVCMNTYTDTSVLCTTVMYGRAIATIAAAAYGAFCGST